VKIWNKTHSISICLRVQVPYFPSQSFPRETGGLRKATQGPQALGSFVSRRLAQYQVWMTFSNIFWISETETFLPQPTALQNSDMSLYNEKKIIESSDWIRQSSVKTWQTVSTYWYILLRDTLPTSHEFVKNDSNNAGVVSFSPEAGVIGKKSDNKRPSEFQKKWKLRLKKLYWTWRHRLS